jgi:two-component system cell cycle response regulator
MDATPSRPATILVVDDQPANINLVRRWLEADGHTVVTALDGEAALAAAAEFRPDAVLLDIMIPAPTGFEVCQRLKHDPGTRHIPVVLMSGLQDPSNWKRGLEVGAIGLLLKPLQGADVRAKIREVLDQTRRR